MDKEGSEQERTTSSARNNKHIDGTCQSAEVNERWSGGGSRRGGEDEGEGGDPCHLGSKEEARRGGSQIQSNPVKVSLQ